jgi:hypothetical protein
MRSLHPRQLGMMERAMVLVKVVVMVMVMVMVTMMKKMTFF